MITQPAKTYGRHRGYRSLQADRAGRLREQQQGQHPTRQRAIVTIEPIRYDRSPTQGKRTAKGKANHRLRPLRTTEYSKGQIDKHFSLDSQSPRKKEYGVPKGTNSFKKVK